MHALQSKHCYIMFLFILWMQFSNGIRNDNLTKCFILIQSDPPTTNGALGRGLALVLLRWNFSLFCMS